MALTDWNVTNEHRLYPFCATESRTLPTDIILDCKFFFVNPATESVKVWLHSMEELPKSRKVVFRNSLQQEMTFWVPYADEWQCIWNTESSDWYAFVVFGKRTVE